MTFSQHGWKNRGTRGNRGTPPEVVEKIEVAPLFPKIRYVLDWFCHSRDVSSSVVYLVNCPSLPFLFHFNSIFSLGSSLLDGNSRNYRLKFALKTILSCISHFVPSWILSPTPLSHFLFPAKIWPLVSIGGASNRERESTICSTDLITKHPREFRPTVRLARRKSRLSRHSPRITLLKAILFRSFYLLMTVEFLRNFYFSNFRKWVDWRVALQYRYIERIIEKGQNHYSFIDIFVQFYGTNTVQTYSCHNFPACKRRHTDSELNIMTQTGRRPCVDKTGKHYDMQKTEKKSNKAVFYTGLCVTKPTNRNRARDFEKHIT